MGWESIWHLTIQAVATPAPALVRPVLWTGTGRRKLRTNPDLWIANVIYNDCCINATVKSWCDLC